MEFVLNSFLYLHIAAGVLTLLLGPVAIYTNESNLGMHRPAGRVFFYAMLVVCVSAAFGFFRRPDLVFYQFLLGIAVFVWAGVMRGFRALQFMKKGPVLPLDYVYTALLGFAGLAMVLRAGWMFARGGDPALPILFGVFGMASLWDASRNLRYFNHAGEVQRLEWLALHVSSMIGAFIASTTAFAVNAAPFMPWYLQWFGPTVLLVPVQVYFGRRLRARVSA